MPLSRGVGIGKGMSESYRWLLNCNGFDAGAAERHYCKRAARADLVVYLAGADPHEGDRLGRLKLTFDGLARRDDLVLRTCREIGTPVCVTIAGGYGRDIADTVRVHLQTVATAARFGE